MNQRSYAGQLGENIACGYLVKNKYKVIERNFRQKWGEIDIIVKAPDRTLVFVEVKTVRGVEKLHTENDDKHISAEDQLTAAKLQKLQRTASLYAGHNQDLVDDKKGWRIDLIALTLLDNHYVIKHYKNI
ncbi:MAG: YraN family protein [Patescibacteria group bacterium]|nr:YraN family protein [Patescibacteria group bacterium]